MRRAFNVVGAAGILILFLLVCLILIPRNHPISDHSDVARIRNAACIGYALSKFQSDHNGHLPIQLSELVPNYIDATNIKYFFPPRVVKFESANTLIATNLFREIDQDDAFRYLGERGLLADIILYERSNLWSPNADANNIVMVSSNFTPKLVSGTDIEKRVASLKGSVQ